MRKIIRTKKLLFWLGATASNYMNVESTLNETCPTYLTLFFSCFLWNVTRQILQSCNNAGRLKVTKCFQNICGPELSCFFWWKNLKTKGAVAFLCAIYTLKCKMHHQCSMPVNLIFACKGSLRTTFPGVKFSKQQYLNFQNYGKKPRSDFWSRHDL